MDPDQWLAGVPRSGGGTSFINPDDPPVWWGYESQTGGSRPATDRGFAAGGSSTGGSRPASDRGFSTGLPKTSSNQEPDRLLTQSGAIQVFYGWSDAERKKWADHLVRLGLIDEDEAHDFLTLKNAWIDVIGEAAALTAAGKRIDPWKVATLLAGGEEGAARRRAAREADRPFTGTRTSTATQVDLTDPATAKTLVNGVLADALGRAANSEELQNFLATLNAAERANPAKQTTSTTYKDGVQVASSSTTSGGLTNAGREQLLLDRAQALPEYGAYQAGTYYYNALLNAIQSPV